MPPNHTPPLGGNGGLGGGGDWLTTQATKKLMAPKIAASCTNSGPEP